jgi:hypothetical protein
MQLDFHGSDFREREPVTVQLHPITILRIGEAVVPATSLEARIAGRLARLHAAKERLERQIDACARFLKRLRKGVIEEWLLGFPARDQLNRIEARQRFAVNVPGIAAHFKRRVVNPPTSIQRAQQGGALGGGGHEAVLVGFSHGLNIPFMLQYHKHKARLISPCLKAGVLRR